jgi:hypothetical protein
MPILNIRPTFEAQALTAPYPPVPEAPRVIEAWLNAKFPCEFHTFPAGYVGNVTPLGWREFQNYLLRVDDSAEQGEMVLVPRALSEDESPAELIEQASLRAPAYQAGKITLARIDVENRAGYISNLVDPTHIAIGGIISHATLPEIEALRSYLPEAPLPPHLEGA